ncbi:hypothetical protein [Prevotella sp. 10(H)]|uniref:hypothetical protein n=1 Tax=Prevotella sp. 10(H) TaxID=1158294 RepID=UPI0012DF472C|nr:hypothetical protein [Prevotella sp. 10(H)]
MRTVKLLCVLIIFSCVSLTASAQLLGAGAQMTEKGKFEFAINAHSRYLLNKGAVNFFLFGAVDYTSGSTKLSGLNIKPVSATLDFAGLVFGDHADKGLLWLSCDAGYLLNFSKKDTDGVVITPNIMCSYSLFYVKTGYDFNVMENNRQFFVRLGLILSL